MSHKGRSERIVARGYAINVHAYESRSGTQIVLVHGIGVSSRYFRRLAAELANTNPVYALDLPGYGDTPKPKRPLSISELADVVNETIAKLGLEKPVLIGHSMGCQIVAEAEQRKPHYRKLILMSPTVNAAERSLFMQGWRLFADTFKEPLHTNWQIFQDYFRMGPIRYLQTTATMLADKLEESVAVVNIPVLVLRGTRDKIAPHDWVEFLKKTAKDGHVMEIRGGAHAVQHTHAEEVAQACREFLNT